MESRKRIDRDTVNKWHENLNLIVASLLEAGSTGKFIGFLYTIIDRRQMQTDIALNIGNAELMTDI